MFVGYFCPAESGSRYGSRDPIETGSGSTTLQKGSTWNWRKHRWIFVPQYLRKAASQLDGEPVSPHHRVQII